MTTIQAVITILIFAAGTMLMRFLPFLVFNEKRPVPKFVIYLGKALPGAVFAMLMVYCLKDVNVFSGAHGIPEALSILLIVILHLWKKNTILSIASGTILYMILVQVVF